ncbi:MAG: hypothetical protein RMK43_13010, partial [Cyclobacteriaceae bacterium]|nr:hypothetical protein [Cyclobacteriaceae bacterium]
MRSKPAYLSWLFIAASCVYAQKVDALKNKSDSILTINDSLSIFQLIDSLIILFEEQNHSFLHARLMYNSNVLAAGRTLGIDQFGLSPGITYHHKSGAYADISGYWSRNFNPNYYLTIFSAGYMRALGKRFTIMASFDHYAYGFDQTSTPFTDALSASVAYDLKHLSIQTDYSYFFGNQQVHRITQSVYGRFEKENAWKADKIIFNPGFYLLLGDTEVTEIILPDNRVEWIVAWLRIRRGLPWYTVRTYRVFGIMNYAFSAPLTFKKGIFNLTLSYMYNIPRALPGEVLDLSESSFFMAGVSCQVPMK